MTDQARAEVVVVGDLMVDVIVVPSGPLHHASDVAATIRTFGGGSAANTACWLGAAGRAVRLVAMVGDDAVAPGALALLEAVGVSFAGAPLPETATGTCVVLVDADGERTMLPDRAANDRLDPALVVAAVDERPGWLHLSGYTLLDEGSRPAAQAGLDRARALGVPVSVDASSAGPLQQVGPERFLGWIEGIHVLFANDDEIAALGGLDACRRHVEVVVAKHGSRGASWVAADATVSVAAAPTTVVDTVGAGDALDAGVIDAVLAGADPEGALRAGTVLAARAVGQPGARP